MNEIIEKFPQNPHRSVPATLNSNLPGEQAKPPQRRWPLNLGIRFKVSLMTLFLLTLITAGTSLVIIDIMDKVLMQSLIKRGTSIGQSTSTPAGFSILANDRLALDNLAAQIENTQKDILFLAILDVKGDVLAHSQMEATGAPLESSEGSVIANGENYTVRQILHEGRPCYEFQVPIFFGNNKVGSVFLGIDAETLTATKSSAHSKIFSISILALGVGLAGTFILSNFITNPIKRLATGVSQIKSGDYQVEVAVTSSDELSELTHNFNEMSKVIKKQKERLEGSAKDLEESYIATVRILAAALDARDNYTFGHSSRVAKLALLIGQKLQLDDSQLKELEMACFLHDIGKIHVPDRILNKQTPLDDQEMAIIRKHPEQGAEILGLADSLHKYVPVVLHHHEWYNGQGYPNGLKAEQIHLFAQIVAIADCFDAMTSSRPYRKGCTHEAAAAEINRYRGTQFAPHLVDLFLETLADYEDDQTLSSYGELL
jgi:putative nucleotidyltransferase with HDIG domain